MLLLKHDHFFTSSFKVASDKLIISHHEAAFNAFIKGNISLLNVFSLVLVCLKCFSLIWNPKSSPKFKHYSLRLDNFKVLKASDLA